MPSSSATTGKDKDASSPTPTVESAVELAKRAFALRKYEEAVDHYATALELATKSLGEHAPETADLYFMYGKALLENAIVQSSVLGKEQNEEAINEDAKATASSSSNGPILSFSGDGEEMDEDEDEKPVVFSKPATVEDEEEDEEPEERDEEDEEGEPEDDFNAAWEVLDLARAIYEKQQAEDEDEEVKLKLADTFIALGDVSLETEKFDQAITDYEAGLKLKIDLLPISSRQIAEAHYKLSIVLDLTSGRLSDAIVHAQGALESIEKRLEELEEGLKGAPVTAPVTATAESASGTADKKGKGKATNKLVRDDLVQNMSKSQIESEIKELKGLREDLALKVEELKTSPNESLGSSAPALAAQALDRELNAASGGSSSTTGPNATGVNADVVNDLTAMVKKRKKPAAAQGQSEGGGKRKAEDGEAVGQGGEKKVKLEA